MITKSPVEQVLEEMERYTAARREHQTEDATEPNSEPLEETQPAPQLAHGYQYSGSAIPRAAVEDSQFPQTAQRPNPTPVRPRGRLLTGFMLLAIFGLGGWQIWSSFFRFSAYGIIESHDINISSPLQGAVQTAYVRQGTMVRQGELILALSNYELKHQLERTNEELRLEQARLSAETAKLHWQLQTQQLENGEAVAQYYEAWSNLVNQIAEQQGLEQRFQRAKRLHATGVMSSDSFDELKYERDGMAAKIVKRREAVEAWRKRAENAGAKINFTSALIEPIMVKIESLQSESQRIQEMMLQCEVRAPTNGRLTRWHARPGEFVKQGDPLFTLVEEESEHVKLFLPQSKRDQFAVGDVVDVEIRPYRGTIPCVVERVEDRLIAAPDQIKKHYAPGEALLALKLRPANLVFNSLGVRSGAEVRLPNRLFVNHSLRESGIW